MHTMGPSDTADLVKEVGAESIGQLVLAMGPDLAASVVHAMGVDLTADLVGALGVGVASGIVQSAGGPETGALVRALGADFTAQLVTKMGVTQNVALVASLGPSVLATLVAAMGPGFIGMLSLSMSSEIFQAIFGSAFGGGSDKSEKDAAADRPVSPIDTYTPAATSSSSSITGVTGLSESVRGTPVTLQPTQRVVVPKVTVLDSSTGDGKLLPHLADGTRIPMAITNNSSISSSSGFTGGVAGTGSQLGGGGTADVTSCPISNAGTAATALSIDSSVGIPAVSGSGAVSGPGGAAGSAGMGGNVGVGHLKAVPLTSNAQQVYDDIAREVRDQGGRFQ